VDKKEDRHEVTANKEQASERGVDGFGTRFIADLFDCGWELTSCNHGLEK
jgi:hypothetical protein